MFNVTDYLGPHKKTGPSSYELAPVPVRAERLSSPHIERYFSGSWGLNEGPHRGTSQGSGKLSPLTPFIWDDLMQEQRINSTHIDSEYIDTFNRLTETTIGELEHAKQIARGNHALSPTEKAKIEQETTIKAIQSKTSEYEARTQSAYSLYGHNPFFLMKELSFRKILESLETSPPDVSAAYTAIDNTYRSALELKRISLQMNILAKQLEALSLRRGQADTGLQAANNISASRADERFTVINQEVNIRFQLLPFFLVEKIATTTGSAREFTLSQSLSHYKAAIDNIIVIEQAAISPYAKANPNINPPLSKSELEALKNLVNLQATTNLGNRWNDYHVSLLHSETVQYLTQATNAFGGLITRSQEAERLQEQSRIASEAQARHLAEQQAQEGARRHAEAQLHAKQQEAKAAAEARAKIAADKIRVYKAEKRAERIRNQQVATRLAERFTEILENFNQYQPKGIDQKLQWMKEKQDELLSADLNADKAEEKAGMFFGSLKRSQRKTSLRKVQTQIDAVARTIENISLSTVSGAAASSRALVITPDGLIAGYEGLPISLAGAIDSLSNARAAIGGGPAGSTRRNVVLHANLGKRRTSTQSRGADDSAGAACR
ncbi:hypothetical protein [Pseudomonas purpurea]|uniref:hypothetical protein n=1 Tax=Pseudomonas purpurea TaxID=3136737 RepID=UPI00326788E5